MTDAPGEACLVNLGAGGVALRRRAAAAAALVALVALVVLSVAGVGHLWRVLLFAPLWFAALCWLQAAART